MKNIVILGVGMSKFGKYEGVPFEEFARPAVKNALTDAGLAWEQVQALYCSQSMIGNSVGNKVAKSMGITGIPITNTEGYCSGGIIALRHAAMAVASGSCDVAMALGVEQQPRGFLKIEAIPMWMHRLGLGSPPGLYYAQFCSRYIHEHGLTPNHLAKVAVKAHRNAALTPYSHYPMADVTVEDVLRSPRILGALTLYMVSPPSDGAAAAIVCTEEVARRFTNKKMVRIAAIAQGSDDYSDKGDILGIFAMGPRIAGEGYDKAGVSPRDIDVAMVSDPTAMGEIEAYEESLLCEKGEGVKMVEEGVFELGGRCPVNTDGGFIARGNAVGACHLASVAEMTWQLRGEAGQRQVKRAKTALVFAYGNGAHCTSTILHV